jgi:hypothetical protein
VPWDSNGSFEPKILPNTNGIPGVRRQDTVDVCARDEHARDSGAFGKDLEVEVSPALISEVTDAVVEEART